MPKYRVIRYTAEYMDVEAENADIAEEIASEEDHWDFLDGHEYYETELLEKKCTNDGEHICNFGYACDACPYANGDKDA